MFCRRVISDEIQAIEALLSFYLCNTSACHMSSSFKLVGRKQFWVEVFRVLLPIIRHSPQNLYGVDHGPIIYEKWQMYSSKTLAHVQNILVGEQNEMNKNCDSLLFLNDSKYVKS